MPSWVEHYPGPQMLSWFHTYKDLGFRLTSIAARGPSSHAGYTAVFLPVSGPEQHLHLDVSMNDVAEYLAFEAGQGFFPTQIAGTCGRGSPAPPCYALVFEPQSPAPQRDVHLFFDWVQVNDRLLGVDPPGLAAMNGNVLSIDAFPSAGSSTKYCLIVDRAPKAREQWKVDRWSNLSGEIADHPKHLAMRRTWSLPRAAVPITHEPNLPSKTFFNDTFLNDKLLSLWKTETLGAWPDLKVTDTDGYPPGDFDGGIKAYGPFD